MSLPKRRLLDRLGASPTYVAPGSRLSGDFETDGALILCGSIVGDGRVGGALNMTAQASWDGEVHVGAAVIAGQVKGKLVVQDTLEISSTAIIHAQIVAKTIAIARGALVDGPVTLTGSQQVVQFEEKRRPD